MQRSISRIRAHAKALSFGALFAFALVPAVVPAVASAASAVSAPNIWGIPPGYWAPGGLVSCTGNYPIGSTTANNPSGRPNCQDLNDLLQTIVNVIYFVMSVALFIIAPILFIVGGLMMILSAGNPEKIGQARKTMIGAVIGVVIVLSAYLIVNTIISFLGISGISGFSASQPLNNPTSTTNSGS